MEEFHFDRALRLAGAFVACAIGSGFATGQEIMQFFTVQGLLSLSGALVTTVIFAWCGSCFMKHGYERGLTAPNQILEFYFGKTAGKAAAIVIQLFLYSLYVVMIAGAGATLSEFFGVRSGLGRVLMAAASLITVLLGLVLSVTDFRKLVNIIYPISGYAGIVVMLTAAFRDVQLRREQ